MVPFASVGQPHPKIPTIRKSTDALNRALEVTYYIRYSLRDSAYFVAPEKKRNYIERYQDRYDVRPPKKYLYKQIDASIQLLPEELVTGKAKRMWIAQRRGTEKLDGDESESESDEESGEEKSKAEDDEDGLDLEDDAEDEDEYEYETFSDDDAGDEDDGPDGTLMQL